MEKFLTGVPCLYVLIAQACVIIYLSADFNFPDKNPLGCDFKSLGPHLVAAIEYG